MPPNTRVCAGLVVILLAYCGSVAATEWLRPDVSTAAWMPAFEQQESSQLCSLDSEFRNEAAVSNSAQDTGGATGFPESELSQDEGFDESARLVSDTTLQPLSTWFDDVSVGYDRGFVIASEQGLDLQTTEAPFLLRVNGLGQLRHTIFDAKAGGSDLNQFQLIRGRLAFSGNAFTPNLRYFVQLDGRSSAGDEFRLLDYQFDFDFGRHLWGLDRDTLIFKTGKYKMPFTMARYLSAREFEFADRSMASMYFDINRSLAWGLGGRIHSRIIPLNWETAIFNGLVTGGAETGSSGTLDNNFAYSARLFAFPTGDWGTGSLADFDWHDTLATRVGAAFAGSTIDRVGATEFNSIRVVDSGERLTRVVAVRD